MALQHHLIIIPGLGDDIKILKFLTKNWQKKYGIVPHVETFGWEGEASLLSQRLEKICTIAQNLLRKGYDVSLLGTSAGGSAALNSYYLFPEISHSINVCGRLRAGINVRPSLKWAAKHHPIFKASVLACEQGITKLTPVDKHKILTIRPFYDEIVPVPTMMIDGAKNKQIIAGEHSASIFIAMTLYAKMITNFVKSSY